VLNHRFAGDGSQWLALEPGRSKARWDDGHNFHINSCPKIFQSTTSPPQGHRWFVPRMGVLIGCYFNDADVFQSFCYLFYKIDDSLPVHRKSIGRIHHGHVIYRNFKSFYVI
jgi:hypothetical protein